MLSDDKINKLNNLLDASTDFFEKYPSILKIVLDAINTWRSEVNPERGMWGISTTDDNVFYCYRGSCCLFGACLVNKIRIRSKTTLQIVKSTYDLQNELLIALMAGFDQANPSHVNPSYFDAYKFSKQISDIVT